MMSSDLRKKYHKRIMKFLEHHYHDNTNEVCHLLAHHALKAELAFKAIDYSEQAGFVAIRGNANEEAVKFFKTAIELEEKMESKDFMRFEQHIVQLGGVYYSLGYYGDAIICFLK